LVTGRAFAKSNSATLVANVNFLALEVVLLNLADVLLDVGLAVVVMANLVVATRRTVVLV
jgi:hypothetical protein